MPDSFFDTNIVLYLALRETAKSPRVEELLETGGTISVQVLNECANVLRLKRRAPWRDVQDFVGALQGGLSVVPVTVSTHQTGLRLAERYGLSVYDSFIAAAAIEANCDTLWSEDMQHGLVVESRLRIANPFADIP